MLKVSLLAFGLAVNVLPAMATEKPPLGATGIAPVDLKCTLIPFDKAEVVGERGHRRLRITILKKDLPAGRTPTLQEVEYFMQPDYYRLILLACPVVQPSAHHVTLSDDGVRITFEEPIGVQGKKGIELEGGKLQKFDLAP